MYAGHLDLTRPLVWEAPAFGTAEECASILARYSDGPWLDATVNSAQGRIRSSAIRNNTVALVRDEGLAHDLAARLKTHVPEIMCVEHPKHGRVEWRFEGLYAPLRIYRYEPGQQFALHHDQSYERDEGCRSLLTFMLYLNEDFTGGTTSFPEQGREIVPRTGNALFFQHAVLHAGARVESGTKLVLRSDVLYRMIERNG